MKKLILTAMLASTAMAAAPPEAEAVGCISGGLAGGAAGHLAGHGVLGAVAGCAAGHAYNKRQKNRAMQDDAAVNNGNNTSTMSRQGYQPGYQDHPPYNSSSQTSGYPTSGYAPTYSR
jgi:uncharacterized protein YcfJ